jgi:hypothetical protein
LVTLTYYIPNFSPTKFYHSCAAKTEL